MSAVEVECHVEHACGPGEEVMHGLPVDRQLIAFIKHRHLAVRDPEHFLDFELDPVHCKPCRCHIQSENPDRQTSNRDGLARRIHVRRRGRGTLSAPRCQGAYGPGLGSKWLHQVNAKECTSINIGIGIGNTPTEALVPRFILS